MNYVFINFLFSRKMFRALAENPLTSSYHFEIWCLIFYTMSITARYITFDIFNPLAINYRPVLSEESLSFLSESLVKDYFSQCQVYFENRWLFSHYVNYVDRL